MVPGLALIRKGALLTLLASLMAPGVFRGQEPSPRTPTLPGLDLPAFPYAAPPEVGLSAAALASLAERVAGWVASGEVVGGEVMVVKDDRIVLHETVGWNDRERQIPLNRNSYYRIRSMTKPVVGTAVLMLVEDGKVGLDDLASQYLPSFDNERSGDITVRQLLRHQAGYEQTAMPNGYWRQGTLREAVDLLGRTGPAHPPADVFRYSDKNPAALGAIIAEVTGAPAERFIQSRIFEPLGLSEMQTRFSPNVSWASRMNSTYRRIGDLWVKYWNPRMQQEFPFFRGSGGIHTTISEYARFLTTWMRRGALDGVRLIDEATVVEALRSDEPIAWGGELPSDHYGQHWVLFAEPNSRGELPVFGHWGSDGTLAMALPEQNMIVLYFTQSRENATLTEFAGIVLESFNN